MKISVLSDLHLDFYFKPEKPLIKIDRIKQVFDKYLTDDPEVEVLVVAGDITHYPSQLIILDSIAILYNYKKIFCVTGNHELYLVSKNQKNKYYNCSKYKMEQYLKYESFNNTVEFLDGNVVEYKGVKFGGAMGWYDGTYNNHGYNYKDPVEHSKRAMNDFKYISYYEDLYDLVEQERPKFKNLTQADVIISHFNPIPLAKAFQEEYRLSLTSMFYAWNGLDIVEQLTKTQHWVFGHSHGYHEFSHEGIQFTMNAHGYPSESGATNKIIEVNNA